jgi:Co/Zn/Cd efflux system component
MGIGTSIFLIALGAILRFGVSDRISGVDLSVIGLILLIVGVIGLVVTLLYANVFARGRDRTVVRDRY